VTAAALTVFQIAFSSNTHVNLTITFYAFAIGINPNWRKAYEKALCQFNAHSLYPYRCINRLADLYSVDGFPFLAQLEALHKK
jgi:hypothetical protein